MTSRFGKTYSRKSGDGSSSSKFDEVLSNKRATLSTKWGETTYKAKVSSKRPGQKSEVAEQPKRPKLSDESSEDPFGFDSDEESKTVTSRFPQAKASPAKPAAAEPPQAGRPGFCLESRSSQQSSLVPSRTTSSMGSDRSQLRVTEDTARFFNTTTTTAKPRQPSWSSEGATAEKHSYSWYCNASESDKKPIAQTTTLKSEAKDSYDNWDAVMGLGPASPTPEPPRSPPSSMWSGEWGYGLGLARQDKTSPEPTPSYDVGLGYFEVPIEPSESQDYSQSLLRVSTHCRTYRRPNKGKQAGDSDSTTSTSTAFSSGPGSGPLKTNNTENSSKPAGRGRTRDFTVLHPSCLSVCNVTIQDRVMEEYTPAAAVATPLTDLGEAGRLQKKTEPAPAKPTRFRPTQSKTKKDTKLDFFGFEENEAGRGATQEEGSSDPVASGSSNYKIKYFGFDDMSDSDEDEGSQAKERRKAKRAAKAAATAYAASAASMEMRVDSPLSGSEELDSQTSSHTDVMDFPEDNSASVGLEMPRRPQAKQVEKSKESRETNRKIFSGPKKSPTKAVYNARHWNREPEELPPPPVPRSTTAPASQSSGSSKDSSNSHKDDGLFKAPPCPPPKVIKSVSFPTEPYQDIVTALKCRKEHKELYTVVQHVKHFNDVVEFGENQEFTDDFEYLATGLKSGQPLNTRCLSVISLATRCAMPSFRMHLRARGKVAQVFKTLNDAPQHPNLSLCTASLMYILSRDRLNMDLDRASLDLMIRLLELDGDHSVAKDDQLTTKEISKVKEKIRKLCDTVHNKHLDLENITTGHLAMETLLSLTSKRAGDWFKEELRLLGGLDHIVDKVKECVNNLSHEDDEEKLMASLWGAERCLRVLESVTVHNPENQGYLIAYKDSQLICSSAKALWHCEEMIQRYSRETGVNSTLCSAGTALPYASHSNVGKAVEDCMRAIIGVLLNLTHDNEWGSTKTGEQEDMMMTSLNCVLRVPQYLPQERRFDIRVLGLGLLINLVEYSARNRYCLVEMAMDGGAPFNSVLVADKEELKTEGSLTAIAALVQLFLQREQAAIAAEAETDDFINDVPKPKLDQSGEWQESGGEIQWVASENNNANAISEKEKAKKEEEEEEIDLTKALQHAGKHMEDSIVASYTALLLGCLCQGSPMNVTTVRESLPKGDFSIMTEMLKKFLNFMNLTCDVGTAGQKSISRVIDYLEHC
ncbi:wings apart-like protein homolog isoform X2 [Coregonus clupeaformis]|uniref:wings apart-like protein homolog isoform X2 n=1 Tax=Coregonus clupeaformis TaxID=59861 RepID=UPI001E1C4369|nr:wings apart-like protein homolog isoform X2 [Coregonus clupeaformis]